MVDRDDKYRRAVYNTFTIESSSSRYRLSVDDFDPSQSVGDPGDAMQFVNGAEFDPGPSPYYNASMTNYFENYRNSLESNEYGTVYTYKCNKGLELSGGQTEVNYTCGWDSLWQASQDISNLQCEWKRCTEPPLLDPSNKMEVKDWRYDGVPVQANVVTIGCKRNWKDDNGQDIDIQASCQVGKQI
ncbi:hypothetical protein TCAL_15033 [Tigriopus californicus]|uniref:Sushi domain-containing protein n=1 Tax=Tigriopus californicus TaxID=6832 RepID=A0A553P018_TIGCA|nr:hypothetical protein TCAL_15033 [Tigriopus californicus]